MKKFFDGNGLWVLAAAAVIAVLLAILSVTGTFSSPAVNAANTLAAPFRSLYRSVAEWVNDKQSYRQDVQTLLEENAALRKENAEMEETIRQARADREENVRLRELLELRQQRRDLTDFEASYITDHNVTNWTSSLTLDKGTSHGIEVNDCVIDETGALVGIVSEAGLNWCTVLTLADTDTSLGAKIFRTGDLGLAQGNFSLMNSRQLRLDYLPAECDLLSGDLVVTSGLGGYLPPDLVIGTVEEVQLDDSGSASFAILTPRSNPDALTEVFVIKSFDIVS